MLELRNAVTEIESDNSNAQTEIETRTDKDAENVQTVTEDQDFIGLETETLTVADNLEAEVESMTEIEQKN
jgi:hypothetical protein